MVEYGWDGLIPLAHTESHFAHYYLDTLFSAISQVSFFTIAFFVYLLPLASGRLVQC